MTSGVQPLRFTPLKRVVSGALGLSVVSNRERTGPQPSWNKGTATYVPLLDIEPPRLNLLTIGGSMLEGNPLGIQYIA
jgi:hypothetical protein